MLKTIIGLTGLLLLFFVFLNFDIVTPNLNGKYYQNTCDGISDTIIFIENSFDRKFTDKKTSLLGQGIYEVHNGNLILYYKKYSAKIDSFKKPTSYSVKSKMPDNSNPKLIITIKDADGKRRAPSIVDGNTVVWMGDSTDLLPFLNVFLLDVNNIQNISSITNVDGIYTYSLKPLEKFRIIKIVSFGYDVLDIPYNFSSDSSYIIDIRLAENLSWKYKESGSDTLWNIDVYKNHFYFKYDKKVTVNCQMLKYQ